MITQPLPGELIDEVYAAHEEERHPCFYNEDGYCVGKMIADASFTCRHMVFTQGVLVKCGASCAETIDIVAQKPITVVVGDKEIVSISSTVPERKCCICGLGSEAGYVASPFATMKDGTSGFIHVHMGCSDAFGVPKIVDEDVMGLIEMSGGVK